VTNYPHAGNAVINYFEAGGFVGSRRQYCCGYEGQSAFWPHTAYFCSVCGELWGRAIYAYEFDYAPVISARWTIEKRLCAEHGDGQFLVGYEGCHLDSCSPELLTRELLALIEGLNHADNCKFSPCLESS